MHRTRQAAIIVAFLVSLVTIAPSIFAQSSQAAGQNIQFAIAAHRACVIAYAEQYAGTKEPASDIATAAVPGCRGMLNDFLLKIPLTVDDRSKLLPDIERLAHELAVRAVLEKRYSSVK